jgi:hypothetical protein
MWFDGTHVQRPSSGNADAPREDRLKHKRPGHKKPIYESVSGDDLHRKSGQWNHLTREIDRENDRYKEVILNPTTGEVIRSVDEPLTEHTGRGSAKPKIGGSGGGA